MMEDGLKLDAYQALMHARSLQKKTEMNQTTTSLFKKRESVTKIVPKIILEKKISRASTAIKSDRSINSRQSADSSTKKYI